MAKYSIVSVTTSTGRTGFAIKREDFIRTRYLNIHNFTNRGTTDWESKNYVDSYSSLYLVDSLRDAKAIFMQVTSPSHAKIFREVTVDTTRLEELLTDEGDK